MQLLSYISQVFASVQDVYDYLAANIPWWDSTANNKLTKENITIEVSSNALLITETNGGQTITTANFISNATEYIGITDDAVIIGIKISGGSYYDGVVISKSTDGTNTHWGAIEKRNGGTAYQKILTYGALAADTGTLNAPVESSYNMQIIPAYASQTRYKINNTFMAIMSPSPLYNGKLTLNNKNFVQCGGLVLQYTE